MILLTPDIVLFHERRKEYLRVMEIQTYPSLNELTAFAHNKDYLWFCCKWLGKEQSWSNTMWGYTSLELNRSCRVVGKLEAAVTLGVRI